MSFKIGEPSSGEGFQKKEYFKLKSGTTLVVRILPAMGALADKGIWNKYYAVHFGYRGTDNKMFLFQSTLEKDRATGTVTVPDAALDRINTIKADIEKLESALESLPADSPKTAAVEAKIEELKKLGDTYNLDKKYYMNVIDISGKIGVLSLGYKDFNQLKELREKLRKEEDIDLVSVKNGIYISLTKSGMGRETTTSMTPYLESTVDASGKKTRDYKTLPITQDLIPRLEREAFDLSNMYAKVTPEQIDVMVLGGSVGVDTVRQAVRGNQAVRTAVVEQVPESVTEMTTVAPVAAAKVETPVVAPAPANTATKSGNVMSDEELAALLGN